MHINDNDINRITVEFKVASVIMFACDELILIESQWNLKN